MSAKFLYGAAVQGIQSFIFQTNTLREIVGASELVAQICEDLFRQTVGEDYKDYDDTAGMGAILHAAGNVKYLFNSREECEKIVRVFPKVVSEYAPGVTVSQAVVQIDNTDNNSFSKAIDVLEERLKVQRNKPMRSLAIGLMGTLRSRQTNQPVVKVEKETFYDDATCKKLQIEQEGTSKLCRAAFGTTVKHENFAHDVDKLTDKNNWIAIIHADGNGLGSVVQKVGKNARQFSEFSAKLDEATKAAALQAYHHVKESFQLDQCDTIPIRPIVLSGDDLTVICRADIAIPYTKVFMEEFERQTKSKIGNILTNNDVFSAGGVRDCLTACAGIAYIKTSYPFYYGYELAETLCSRAKKDAKHSKSIKDGKKLPESCLMFHKVQDSFVEDFDTIAERELRPKDNISFEFGPYYLASSRRTGRESIDWLIDMAKKLSTGEEKEGNSVKSHLRQWMSLLHDDEDKARQKINRLLEITNMKDYVKDVTSDGRKRMVKKDNQDIEATVYPVYDILAINTINNQVTK